MPKKLTTDEFIKKAKAIHGDKYDYSVVDYQGGEINVKIICQIHGVFDQSPHNHLKGKGCWACAGVKPLTNDEFIERANKLYNFKFDYTKTAYEKTNKKVIITCPIHGDFKQIPMSHLKGHGCPKCGIEKKVSTYMSRYGVSHYNKTDEYKEKVKKTCIKKYGVDNPVKVNAFKQKMFDTKLINGSFNTSEPEEELYSILVDKFGEIDVIRQYKSLLYPFRCDFYIKSIDCYIELNAYWSHGEHFFNEQNVNDTIKLELWKHRNALYKNRNNQYAKAIYVWTKLDLLKVKTAMTNNLNYHVFWNNDLSDAKNWLNSI